MVALVLHTLPYDWLFYATFCYSKVYQPWVLCCGHNIYLRNHYNLLGSTPQRAHFDAKASNGSSSEKASRKHVLSTRFLSTQALASALTAPRVSTSLLVCEEFITRRTAQRRSSGPWYFRIHNSQKVLRCPQIFITATLSVALHELTLWSSFAIAACSLRLINSALLSMA